MGKNIYKKRRRQKKWKKKGKNNKIIIKKKTAQRFTVDLHSETLSNFSFFLILFAISLIFILLLVKFTLSREK